MSPEDDDEQRQAEIAEAIVASYRAVPQSRQDDRVAMANALALIAAEPW